MTPTYQSTVSILSSLKSKQSPEESKPSKVRFHEPSSNKDQCTEIETKRHTQKSDVDVASLYGGRLLRTVSAVVCSCLDQFWSNTSETDLILATELIKVFFCPSMLTDILNTLHPIFPKGYFDKTSFDTSVCLSCIYELVLPLLHKECQNVNEKRLSCAVQLLFLLLVEVEESKQKWVLERIFQVKHYMLGTGR